MAYIKYLISSFFLLSLMIFLYLYKWLSVYLIRCLYELFYLYFKFSQKIACIPSFFFKKKKNNLQPMIACGLNSQYLCREGGINQLSNTTPHTTIITTTTTKKIYFSIIYFFFKLDVVNVFLWSFHGLQKNLNIALVLNFIKTNLNSSFARD